MSNTATDMTDMTEMLGGTGSQTEHRHSTESMTATPTLDAILRSIFHDASHDSLRYVLRSDVGHDGE